MLANSLALITLAVMLGAEAKRAQRPWSGGLWSLATLCALVGIALKPITNKLPEVGGVLESLFSQPLAWFVLLIGLFLALRPFWVKSPAALASVPTVDYQFLGRRAAALARHVEDYRATRPLFRQELPDITQVVFDGTATFVMLEKAGFAIPALPGPHAEHVAVGMQFYFSRLHPFLRDGLIDEARSQSAAVAEAADRFVANFDLQEEFWTGGW